MQTLLGVARSADIDLGGSNKPVPVVAGRLKGRTTTGEADAVRGPNMASAQDARRNHREGPTTPARSGPAA